MKHIQQTIVELKSRLKELEAEEQKIKSVIHCLYGIIGEPQNVVVKPKVRKSKKAKPATKTAGKKKPAKKTATKKKSEYKGVRPSGKKWAAAYWDTVKKKPVSLGTYVVEEIAAAAVQDQLGNTKEAARLRQIAHQKNLANNDALRAAKD